MYAELECKTYFSFLQGASAPQELIEKASALGLRALAITDCNGVYGIPKAYWAAKDHPQLQLIVGAELTLSDHPPVTILVADRQAYGALCRLITEAHQDQPKGEPALKKETLLERLGEGKNVFVLLPAGSAYGSFRDVFGQRAYLKISRFLDGHDRVRTEEMLVARRQFGLDLVATNNVHYHVKDRRTLQDIMTSIRYGVSLEGAGYQLFSNANRVLKSPLEMRRLFHDLPEAITATLDIAESCQFSPAELRYRYPSEWIPVGKTAQSYLEDLTWMGAEQRYPDGLPLPVRRQLLHELGIIAKLQYADYFLTIYDIVDFARKRKILCQGRGSAANSAVCFCLGITAIDPVRMNLLFERFISIERNEPPDIDVDFEHERREEVIQYIYEKYGRHRAAMVAAVITYQRRSSLRDVQKAAKETPLAVDQETIESLAKQLEGFPRHLSIHSGGFTLSADPITEIVPVEPARMPGRTIIQWDKYDLDYLGLLKVDVLSLGMLSALHKTLDQVGMELAEIPPDDPATYRMIKKADTVGTFQIESRAQMSMLGRLQPENFYDLVIEVAIVRPGPIVGKMVHPYLRRRRGLEAVEFPHPRLRDILGKTLGVPLFQEQIMKIAIELGGFSPGEADELRRAIGAWRSQGSLEKMGRRLMQGLVRSGLSPEYAQNVYDQIQGFSKYGFPESHAASFALLAYASCYLKCHHPAEFTAAVINSQPMGFYANHTLIDDAKRHGVKVLPLDPNDSDLDCQAIPQEIRLGWRVVKGISEKEAQQIVEGRPYQSLSDFLRRTQLRQDILHRLALAGVFSRFGGDPRPTLWQILDFDLRRSHLQMDLFADFADQERGLDTGGQSEGQFLMPVSPLSQVVQDYRTLGLSVRGHPMQELRRVRNLPPLTTQEARAKTPNSRMTLSGLILIRQRPPTARGMTFATMEDETGFLDLVLYPDVYARHRDIFKRTTFLTVSGLLQKDRESVSLLVQEVQEAVVTR